MNTIFKTLVSFIFFTCLAHAGSNAQKYDSGVQPSIAKQDDVIVEVHKSGASKKLWYRVGLLKNNTIEWGKSYHYAQGETPAIAVFNNAVVEVHTEVPEELWYHVGSLDKKNKKIIWGESHHYNKGLG